MTLRLWDALKMFFIVLTAILIIRYLAHELGLTSWIWQKPIWQSAVFAAVFSLGYTIYRKSKA